MDPPLSSKSWSIHTRKEIISKYQVQERVGSGAYSDVYKARRLSDNLTVALKEIHDYQSAFREIEALQALQNCPNIVVLYEYFWAEDEDAVLVLEYLPTDLGAVIKEAKKGEWREEGLRIGEIKRWMIQMLCAVDVCHRNSIVHRDLKPTNLLISSDGVLKLADFGQARILLAPGFLSVDDSNQQTSPYFETVANRLDTTAELGIEGRIIDVGTSSKEVEYGGVSDELKAKDFLDDIDHESSIPDGDTSCLATCTASDREEDTLKQELYEAEEGENEGLGPLTSCVGTRWYRAPELLYGSTMYGQAIDLWSLGCVFSELLSLEPLFPGISDIDQLAKIFSVLGNLSPEVWPGCVELPDYNTISFNKVESPLGLEACLANRSSEEVLLVRKLLCFDPASRATGMELLQERYLNEEPLPVPISDLRVPSDHSTFDDDSSMEWGNHREDDSESEFDDFGSMNVTTSDNGFSIRFS